MKQNPNQDIIEVLNQAEEKMYLSKTLDRNKVQGFAVDDIILALHENGAAEREHSIKVSELCPLSENAYVFSHFLCSLQYKSTETMTAELLYQEDPI